MGQVVERRFAAEYECSTSTVRSLAGNAYAVKGCGYSVTYVCTQGRVCIKEAEGTQPTSGGTVVASSAARPLRAGSGASAKLRQGANAKGEALVQLELTQTSWGHMTLTAAPLLKPQSARIVIALFRACETCDPRVAVDGSPLAIVEETKTIGARGMEFTTSLGALAKMAAAERTVIRIGKLQWDLQPDDRRAIAEFLLRIREEQALSGEIVETQEAAATPSDSL